MVTWSILNLRVPSFISLERLKLESWNFVCKVRYISFSLTMTTYPQMSVVRVTWPIFWGVTVCKTVHPILSDHCLSVLSVCDVGVLWPNGWMDQDATWYGGRPRPMPHCVRSGNSSPLPKGHSPHQFLAHICCGQTAGWLKMPLYGGRAWPRRHCDRWGSPKRDTAAPTF